MTAPTPEDITATMRLLAETPRRLAAASQGLSPERLHARPDAETWSANDILAHLRACADVWGGGIRTMLTAAHPSLRYLSPRTYIRKTKYPAMLFEPSLKAYASQRLELLGALQPLPFASWLRGATILTGAKNKEETVFSYARRLALHEQGHCEQFEALLRAASL